MFVDIFIVRLNTCPPVPIKLFYVYLLLQCILCTSMHSTFSSVFISVCLTSVDNDKHLKDKTKKKALYDFDSTGDINICLMLVVWTAGTLPPFQ